MSYLHSTNDRLTPEQAEAKVKAAVARVEAEKGKVAAEKEVEKADHEMTKYVPPYVIVCVRASDVGR